MKKRAKLAWAGLLLAAVMVFGAGMAAAPSAMAKESGVEASTAVPSGRYTGVTKSATAVHSTAALANTNVVGTIPKDEVAVITARGKNTSGDELYKVSYQDANGKDIVGYIRQSFLNENTDLVYITASDVNLRESNSTGSTSLLKMPKGATLEVVKRNTKWNGWIKVNYKGKTGFVSAEYAKSDEEIKKEEKQKAEEELKKLKEEIANTIDCADIEFENVSAAYDGKYHNMPRVTNLPDGVEVSYTGASKYKNVGVYFVKATFKAEQKGKKLVNASPRVAFLRISVEKGYAFTAKGLKYEVTKANERGYGTVVVKGITNKKLKTLKIPEAVKVGGVRFMVTEIGKKAFKGHEYLKTIFIGKKVITVGAAAFQDCKAITTVRIGANVTTIGDKAFYNDPNLKEVNIVSVDLKTVGKNAFGKTADGIIVYIPGRKFEEYSALLAGKGLAKTVQFK